MNLPLILNLLVFLALLFGQAPGGVTGLRQAKEQGEEHQQIEDQRQIHWNSH